MNQIFLVLGRDGSQFKLQAPTGGRPFFAETAKPEDCMRLAAQLGKKNGILAVRGRLHKLADGTEVFALAD